MGVAGVWCCRGCFSLPCAGVTFPGQVVERCDVGTDNLFGLLVCPESGCELTEFSSLPAHSSFSDAQNKPAEQFVVEMSKNVSEKLGPGSRVQLLHHVNYLFDDSHMYVFVAYRADSSVVGKGEMMEMFGQLDVLDMDQIAAVHNRCHTTSTTSSTTSSTRSTTSSSSSTTTSSSSSTTSTTSTSTTSTTTTSTSSTTTTVTSTTTSTSTSTTSSTHHFHQVGGRPGCCRPQDQPKWYRESGSLAYCIQLCVHDRTCKAIEYTANRQLCELYPVVVSSNNNDRHCECWSKRDAPDTTMPQTQRAKSTSTSTLLPTLRHHQTAAARITSTTCSGKATNETFPRACQCGADCFSCMWRARLPMTCYKCKNSMYLLDGNCVTPAQCMQTGGVPFGHGSFGRRCKTGMKVSHIQTLTAPTKPTATPYGCINYNQTNQGCQGVGLASDKNIQDAAACAVLCKNTETCKYWLLHRQKGCLAKRYKKQGSCRQDAVFLAHGECKVTAGVSGGEHDGGDSGVENAASENAMLAVDSARAIPQPAASACASEPAECHSAQAAGVCDTWQLDMICPCSCSQLPMNGLTRPLTATATAVAPSVTPSVTTTSITQGLEMRRVTNKGRGGCCRGYWHQYRSSNFALKKEYKRAADVNECIQLCSSQESCKAIEYTDFRELCEMIPVSVTAVRTDVHNFCDCWSLPSV